MFVQIEIHISIYMNSRIAGFCLLFLFFSVVSIAQPVIKLTIDGIVKDEENGYPLENSVVEIMDNGKVSKTMITTVTGKFIFDVEPEVEYVLRCSKERYVSKMVTISTKGISDKIVTNEAFKFPMAVRLFKEMPELDVSVLNSPIGAIFFDKNANDFDYTVDKVLKKRLEKLQEEVESNIKMKAEAQKQKQLQQEKEAKLNAEIEAKNAKEKLKAETRNAELAQKLESKLKEEEEELAKNKKDQALLDEKLQKELRKKEAENKKKIKKTEEDKQSEEQKKARLESAKEKITKKTKKENDSVPIASTNFYIPKKDIGPVIENVSQTVEEGINYIILHTFCLYNGDPVEFKKISFTWGGTYFKKNNGDISDLTYYLEMRSVNPESAEPPR